jgi:hypothetical protein
MSLNCGHQGAYLFIPKVIYEHGEPWWNNDVNRRKLLIHPPELSAESSVSKQEESEKGMRIWSCEVFFFIHASGFLHA